MRSTIKIHYTSKTINTVVELVVNPHSGVGVGGGVAYYNFPRSTNKIKSFDEILTSEKNYIFLHFSVVGESQT